MKTYISLLRGINVSGQKKILMKDLKILYESLKLNNVTTYLQSGNVLFESKEPDHKKISASIEKKIKEDYSYDVSVLVLNPQSLFKTINNNPFLNKHGEPAAKLYVTFLYEFPSDNRIQNLLSMVMPGKDEFSIGDKEIYIVCPDGYGRSKLSNNFFENKLKVRATTRNWKTVNALYDLAVKR